MNLFAYIEHIGEQLRQSGVSANLAVFEDGPKITGSRDLFGRIDNTADYYVSRESAIDTEAARHMVWQKRDPDISITPEIAFGDKEYRAELDHDGDGVLTAQEQMENPIGMAAANSFDALMEQVIESFRGHAEIQVAEAGLSIDDVKLDDPAQTIDAARRFAAEKAEQNLFV